MKIMPPQLILPFAAALPLALGGIAFRTFRAGDEKGYLRSAIGYCFLYNLALSAPHLAGIRVGHWNWVGKAGGILVSVACWKALRLGREEIGWRLPADRTKWAVILMGTFILAALSYAERVGKGPRSFDTETLLFQALMPGLDEELAYRGVLYALLVRALPGPRGGVLAAALVTLAFWMVHVVQVEDQTLMVQGLKLDTLVAGALFMWMRRSTGTVFGPMLAHDLDNVLNTMVMSRWS